MCMSLAKRRAVEEQVEQDDAKRPDLSFLGIEPDVPAGAALWCQIRICDAIRTAAHEFVGKMAQLHKLQTDSCFCLARVIPAMCEGVPSCRAQHGDTILESHIAMRQAPVV